MHGPMTRARIRKLNLDVISFLTDPFHSFENRLLPNDVILLRNIGEGHGKLGARSGGGQDQQGRPRQAEGPVKLEFESVSTLKTSVQ